jgi:Lon-like protease
MTSPIVPTGDQMPDLPPEADGTPDGRGPGPAAPSADGSRPLVPHRGRRNRLIVAVLAIVAAVVAAMFLVELPYYLVQPGQVRPTVERIEISGATEHEDDGEILFTTVLLTRATPALMLRAQLDDAIEVRSESELYPDGDIEGVRELNIQRMDLSKLVATRVALEYLGFDASFDAEGARVLGLTDESPSEGLLRPGDVIVGVDGGEIGMPGDIAEELADRAPGDEVPVVVQRPDSGGVAEAEVGIVLGAADDGDGGPRPVLGVEVEPKDPVVESPVTVEVDSGEVSGPSAGLAWTLGIIDRLTPGALTGGEPIAVTGEVFDDGSVGEVGGVLQKVAAVRRAGIGLFLYPASTPEDQQREMRRIAGSAVTLRPVATVEEAVEVLAPEGVGRPD